MTISIVEKGNIGEQSLITWFHENSIPFLAIDQSPGTFAHFFAKNGKRPDFLILLHSLGLIAVDAKNCMLSNGYFTINEKEITDALYFQLVYRIAFWFAFLHIQHNIPTWYWINAVKAAGTGIKRQNSKTGQAFRAISLGDFVPIRNKHDLGELWIDQVSALPTIKNLKIN